MHATCSWSEVSGVMWGPWGGSSISLSLQTLHIATAAVWSLSALRGPPDPSSCLPFPFSWSDLYSFWKDWQIVSFCTWEHKTFIYYLRHKVISNFFLFALIKAWEWHFSTRVPIWGVLQTPWRGGVIHLILKPFRNTQSYFHVIIFSLNTSANLFFPRMKACIGLSTTCSRPINFDLYTRSPNKPEQPPADTTYTEQRQGHGHAFQHINGHTLT